MSTLFHGGPGSLMLRRELKRRMFGRSKSRFPFFSLLIVLSVLSSWVRQGPNEQEKEEAYQQRLEAWRAHPEFVAHPTRSK